MNNQLSKYNEFLSLLFSKGSAQYDSSSKKITLEKEFDDIIELCDEYGIENKIQHQKLVLEKDKFPFSFFWSETEFRGEVKESSLKKDVILYRYSELQKELIYDNQDGKTYYDDKEVPNYLIYNSKIYFHSKNFFSEQFNAGEPYEFVDFYSESARKIVFASLTEKRRLTLMFPKAGIPEISTEKNYSNAYNEFLQAFDDGNKHLPTFIKNSMIAHISLVSGDKYAALLDNLESILTEAKLNFNVYLNELSLEKIKREYKEYKQKYFSQQNEIISKISTQVFALPISIAGSAFAISKLKDSEFALWLILLGLFSFAAYVSSLVNTYWEDVIEIKKNIIGDFQKLQNQQFFQEHSDELVDFTKTKDWINGRAEKLLNRIHLFHWLIWISTIALCVFCLTILFEKRLEFYLIISLASAFAFATFDYYFLKNNENQ